MASTLRRWFGAFVVVVSLVTAALCAIRFRRRLRISGTLQVGQQAQMLASSRFVAEAPIIESSEIESADVALAPEHPAAVSRGTFEDADAKARRPRFDPPDVYPLPSATAAPSTQLPSCANSSPDGRRRRRSQGQRVGGRPEEAAGSRAEVVAGAVVEWPPLPAAFLSPGGGLPAGPPLHVNRQPTCRAANDTEVSPLLRIWMEKKAATVHEKAVGVRGSRGCPRESFVILEQACKDGGYGNCLFGLIGGILVALATDSVPVFSMPGRASVLRGLKSRFGDWSEGNVKGCYEGILRMSSEISANPQSRDTGKMLQSLIGKGVSYRIGSTGKYYGAYALFHEDTRQILQRLFPQALSRSHCDFGAFGELFRAFFQQRAEAVKEVSHVMDASSWQVAGPLWAVHIRKGFSDCSSSGRGCGAPSKEVQKHLKKRNPGWTLPDWPGHRNITWHAAHCLAQALESRHISEARIYVASNYVHVWNSFRQAFRIGLDGIARGALAGGRRLEFKPSTTISRGTATASAGDVKSHEFMLDWHVLTRAQVLLVHGRTSYSNTALAVAKPENLYVFDGQGPVKERAQMCEELQFREACMHDGDAMRKLAAAFGQFALDYVTYCDKLGAFR